MDPVIRWKQKSIQYFNNLSPYDQDVVYAICYNLKQVCIANFDDSTVQFNPKLINYKMLTKVFPSIKLTDPAEKVKQACIELAIKFSNIINNAPLTANLFVSVSSGPFIRNSAKICTDNQFTIGVCKLIEDEKHFILRIPGNMHALYLHKSLSGVNDGCVILPMNSIFRKVYTNDVNLVCSGQDEIKPRLCLFDYEECNPYDLA